MRAASLSQVPDCTLYMYAEKSCVFTNDKQAVFSKFLLGIWSCVNVGYSSLERLLELCARSRTVATIDPMADRQEELKRLLMKVKEESEKAGLRLNIQKTKIIVSNPITSWKVEGENVEAVIEFIFLGSKIYGCQW